MLRNATTLMLTVAVASQVFAELRIEQWNPNITEGFEISLARRTILITTGHPTEVFKFEAYDDSNNEPETINEISVQTGAGTVLLAVIGDPAGERTLGAADLEKLDLSQASSSTLVQVKIDTDLGEDGRVAHPSRSEGWGRDSFGWKGENSAVCGGRY
jgi:hypothetical protein